MRRPKRILEALRDKPIVSRRVHHFLCKGPLCRDSRRPAQSKRKALAKDGLCRDCRKAKVNENQMSFLPAGEMTEAEQKEHLTAPL